MPLWSGYMAGTSTEAAKINACETDGAGSIYYIGRTPSSSYNYHPFGGNLIMSPVYGSDFFIVKVSSEGDVIWGKTIGGSGEDIAEDIAIDDSGYVYITGTFQGTVDFDPGAGVDNYTAPSNSNQFILKMDTAGNYVWNKTIVGPYAGSNHTITVDHDHNILVAGWFSTGTMDFDPSASIFNLPYTSGADMSVLKLDYNGDFVWAKAVGGDIHQIPTDITTDTLNNVFITGNYMETVDFDPGIGTDIHTSVGGRDIFLLKLNELGDFQWVHTMGGSLDDYGSAVQTDVAGNVYFTGDFKGTVDFGVPGNPMPLTSPSGGSQDMFIQRLNPNGIPYWVKQIGGSAAERPKEIKIDNSNNIIIGGSFQGTTDFDPGAGIAQSTVFNPDDDVFILKLDSIGEYIFHATTYSAEDEFCAGIALGPDGSIYLAGNFDGYVDLSLGEGTHVYGTGSLVVRPYVAKYHQCTHSVSTETIVSCDSYFWPLTGLTYSSTNTYSSAETDIYGCDSTVYLDLTVNTVDLGVSQNDFTLTSDEVGAIFQWIDCGTLQAISDETGQSYTATANGLFSVYVDNGLCSDTSACILIEGVGIDEYQENQLLIYPNPASDHILIGSDYYGNFKILDITGKLILYGYTYSNKNIDVSSIQAGAYIIIVFNLEGTSELQSILIKE